MTHKYGIVSIQPSDYYLYFFCFVNLHKFDFITIIVIRHRVACERNFVPILFKLLQAVSLVGECPYRDLALCTLT